MPSLDAMSPNRLASEAMFGFSALSSCTDRLSSPVRRSASRAMSAVTAFECCRIPSRRSASAMPEVSSSFWWRFSSPRRASFSSAASALSSSVRLARSAGAEPLAGWAPSFLVLVIVEPRLEVILATGWRPVRQFYPPNRWVARTTGNRESGVANREQQTANGAVPYSLFPIRYVTVRRPIHNSRPPPAPSGT